MPKFQVSDSNTGKKYVITAPDQATAVAAFQTFQKTNAVGGSATNTPPRPPAADLGLQGLAIPGTQPPAGAPAIGVVPQSQGFGLGSSDNPNPLPALSAGADAAVSQLPIIGQPLQDWRDKVNASVYGGTSQDARADIDRMSADNPTAVTVGKIAGQTLPYIGAAEVPLLRGALGFEGPLAQRLGMTFGSQYAINTGDNLSKGQDPVTAATNAVGASAAATPFALLGKGRGPQGAQADAVNVMKQEGIPLTAGQMKGSKPLMTMESQLGGAATGAFQDRQLGALTKAALKRAGVSANAATPNVLREAYDKIGSKFDGIAAMTHVRVDNKLQNDLLTTATNYQDAVGQAAPLVEKFINRVGTLAQQNGGILRGDNYKILTTDLRKAAEGSSSIEVKTALNEMRTALDDAVERSMGGKTRDAWQVLRQQYKNLIHVTDAVGGAGEKAAKGLLTPASLRAAVSAGDKRNYAKGYGDLNELSHAANITMTPIPDSGTAGRLASMAGFSAMPAAATALATGNPGHAAAIFGGLAAPAIAGHAMLSAPGRALLGGGGTAIPAAVARGVAPTAVPSLLQMLGISQ